MARLKILLFYVYAATLVLAPAGVWLLPVSAETADSGVSVRVPDTVLRVTGKTFPGAFVTILDDGATIGTVVADSSGNFDKSFPAQTPGIHTIEVYARDMTTMLTTDPVSQSVNLQEKMETTLTFYLPPIMVLSDTEIEQGEDLELSGRATPGWKVTVVIDNNLNFTTTVDSSGNWSITIQTDGFYVGTHQAYAVARDQSGNQSYPTSKRAFEVTAADAEPAPPASEPGEGIEPPVFTKPQPNQHFSQTPIEVCGTAAPNSQVEIWEDGEVIGSVFANHRGEWCFRMDLFKPRHEITARVCIGQTCSDFSKPLVIFFDGPGADFLLKLAKYRYASYVGEPITLDITLEGGEPPYELLIDWGADAVDPITTDNHRLKARFAYQAAGHYIGIVTAKDSDGTERVRYFSVVVTERPTFPILLLIILIILLLCLIAYLLWRKIRARKKANHEHA